MWETLLYSGQVRGILLVHATGKAQTFLHAGISAQFIRKYDLWPAWAFYFSGNLIFDLKKHLMVKVKKTDKKKITVVGAGYMGSAITYPLASNGYEINLVGTWLDDDLIKSSIAGLHPKLKKSLPDSVLPRYWKDLEFSLKDSEIVFIGVSSEGFVQVLRDIFELATGNHHYFKLTKGLVKYNGKIIRANQAACDIFSKKFSSGKFYLTTIGGPVNAQELSRGIPTASVYGISDDILIDLSTSFSNDYYYISLTRDSVGLEISSAFKNVYAIAIGICDGLYKKDTGHTYHNFNAFIFNQSLLEISKIVISSDGDAATVFNLGGMGDLYAATVSSRNRKFGEYIGRGQIPSIIYKKMYVEGELAEGYNALYLGKKWLKSLGFNIKRDLPLFDMVYSIVHENGDTVERLKHYLKYTGHTLKNKIFN